MFLQSLSVTNFRNCEKTNFLPEKRFICFTGNNGAGKTSLLDSIRYLCLTKSFLNSNDRELIRQGADFFRLEAIFSINENRTDAIVITLPASGKKEVRCNGLVYDRLSDHIGKYPVVVIAPDDSQLVSGGSEYRRKLLDNALCQAIPNYLPAWMAYSGTLTQRNAALKSFAEKGKVNHSLLDVYDQKLITSGREIFLARKAFCQNFSQKFASVYASLSPEQETPGLNYESLLETEDFAALLKKNRNTDIALQRTSCGPHRDDLLLTLDQRPVKRFGSQGQQKTFLLALKLAEFQFIASALGITPLLLLDDIFDKLDAFRSARLMEWLTKNNPGQVFITDTGKNNIEKIPGLTGEETLTFEVRAGKVSKPNS